MKNNKNDDIKLKKSIFQIIYIFLGLFVLTIGYFTYFIIVKSNDVINSSYNKRQSVLAEQVIRGKILSSDGKILAQTVVDEAGNEVREYPYDNLFVHVVGRYSKGITGIEGYENIRLLTSNSNAFQNMYNDFIGEKKLGDNVVTTLDVELQKTAYEALGDNRGAVVVMEPSTGKILAMVSKPDYNPNQIDAIWSDIVKEEEESPLINRATQGLYPPGSTFKLLTALEFMRENPDYMDYDYNCKGSIEYDGMVIHCSHNAVHGKVDLPLSLAKSCNASFSSIGQELDINKLNKLSEDFLFNKNLSVDMESNASSFTLTPSSGMKEIMQTVIGQGKTLISPLHNAMITAAIANGGVMMKPYTVDQVISADGNIVKEFNKEVYTKPLTSIEANYLSKMMREVVTKGTAKDLNDLDVKVAGKTGSADQKGKSAHAWFVGFAPYKDPEIVVSIIVESKGTGSDYAVPIAEKIFETYFNNK